MKKRNYVLIILIILSAVVLEEILRRKNVQISIIPNEDFNENFIKPKKQITDKRIFKDIILEKEFILNTTKETNLYAPNDLRFDEEKNIYIRDAKDNKIKVFSSGGKYIKEIGKGKGEGPGEFLFLKDFSVDKNGDIFAVDERKNSLSIFDRNGKLKDERKIKDIPLQIAHMNNSNLIIKSISDGKSGMFSIYTTAGEKIKEFGSLIPGQEKYGMLAAGIMCNDDNNIYFSTQNSGLLFSFNSEGDLNFFVETIDPSPLPKIKIKTNGNVIGQSVEEGTPLRCVWIQKDGNSIFIQDYKAFKEENVLICDRYNASDGSYLYSLKLSAEDIPPNKFLLTQITENNVYMCNKMSIIKYKYSVLN